LNPTPPDAAAAAFFANLCSEDSLTGFPLLLIDLLNVLLPQFQTLNWKELEAVKAGSSLLLESDF